MCMQSHEADPHLPQQFTTLQSTEHRPGCKWESGLGISGFLCQFKKDMYESLQICRGNGRIISLLIHLGDGNHTVPWGYTTVDTALVHLKMPEVPETLPLLSVDVKQGRNAERRVPLETFLTLISEKHEDGFKNRKKKRGNQLKPLHKLSLIASTLAHHTMNLVKLTYF